MLGVGVLVIVVVFMATSSRTPAEKEQPSVDTLTEAGAPDDAKEEKSTVKSSRCKRGQDGVSTWTID